ncbi:MAG: DUF3445 domain-containing protein [Marinovum sp.]|nr:DUF3445 domain-containing protein [Marinovum sp.]
MILQKRIPYPIFPEKRLPAVTPLDPTTWIDVDDAYAAQMAERARLLAEHPMDVVASTPGAEPVLAELFDFVLSALNNRPGFKRSDNTVTCPDGRRVALDSSDVLMTLGQLVQEDLCLIMKPDGASEHMLAAAVLCFPASWRLGEKIGRPLTTIHEPVAEYNDRIAKGVQRLFDGVQPDRPLWRFNVLYYDDPVLHQPRSAIAPRAMNDPQKAPFVRSERQCIQRLPKTGAALFSIHTYVVKAETAAAHD